MLILGFAFIVASKAWFPAASEASSVLCTKEVFLLETDSLTTLLSMATFKSKHHSKSCDRTPPFHSLCHSVHSLTLLQNPSLQAFSSLPLFGSAACKLGAGGNAFMKPRSLVQDPTEP